MAKLKKHIYSPNTVVLDMKNQPDAEAMLKIAKSINGVKVEVVKSGQVVKIHYPKVKGSFHLHIKAKPSMSFWSMLESYNRNKDRADDVERTSDAGLYHAMILK